MIVGITQRIDNIKGRSELRDALDQKLTQWLIQAGLLPVSIPNSLFGMYCSGEIKDELIFNSWLQAIRPQALILSGGNDIHEYPQRDATERHLLSWAEANQVPVLGICRGLQIMADWAGTSLTQVEGHVGTQHKLVVSDRANEWPATVNSYHNWSPSECPSQYEVMAQAEDGAIEAMRHISLPWEGWMWHPEREEPFCRIDMLRIKRLFDEKQIGN